MLEHNWWYFVFKVKCMSLHACGFMLGGIVYRVLLNLFFCWIFYSEMSSNVFNLHTLLLLFHLAVDRLTLLSPVPDGLQACRRSTSNLIEPLLNCPKHSEWLMQEASSLWTLSFCQASTIIPSSQTNGHSGTPCKENIFWNNTMLVFFSDTYMCLNADEDKTQQSCR